MAHQSHSIEAPQSSMSRAPLPSHFNSHHPSLLHGAESFWSFKELEEAPAIDQSQGLTCVLEKLARQRLPGLEHLESFLREARRRNCRTSTIKTYAHVNQMFLRFFKRQGKSDLEAMTRDDIGAYIEHEQDRGLRPFSVITRVNILYTFVRFLVDQGVVHPDLSARKLRVKSPDLLPRSMADEDVRRLLSVIDHIRDRAMIFMLLRTGMRIGELLTLQALDLNLTEQKVMIYQAPKTHVGRVVYISEDAMPALAAWIEERDSQKAFLFYACDRDRMSYSGARMMFKRYLKRAGLSHKGYTLHRLRHTFATQLLNAGMRLECLQQLMGHTHLEITRRYARLTDQTRENEYFRAMAIIERSERDGHHQLDHELAALFEEEELFSSHD